MSYPDSGLGLGLSYGRLFALTSGLASAAVISFLFLASRSGQFVLKDVEWKGDLSQPQFQGVLDTHDLLALSHLNPGTDDLLFLPLERVASALKTHPWVRNAVLEKRFPNRLQITIEARKPVLIFQAMEGVLRFVDEDGTVFGEPDLKRLPKVPLVQGISDSDRDQLRIVHGLAAELQKGLGVDSKNQSTGVTLGSMTFDQALGFRAWISYPYVQKERQKSGVSRALVLLGKEAGDVFPEKVRRLSSVITYLAARGVPAKEIYAEESKKIVVQIRSGS